MAVVADEADHDLIEQAGSGKIGQDPAELLVPFADSRAVPGRAGAIVVGREIHLELVNRDDRWKLPVTAGKRHGIAQAAEGEAVDHAVQSERDGGAGGDAVLIEMRRPAVRLEKERKGQPVRELLIQRSRPEVAVVVELVLVGQRLVVAVDEPITVEPLGRDEAVVAGKFPGDQAHEVVHRQGRVTGRGARHIQATVQEVLLDGRQLARLE